MKPVGFSGGPDGLLKPTKSHATVNDEPYFLAHAAPCSSFLIQLRVWDDMAAFG